MCRARDPLRIACVAAVDPQRHGKNSMSHSLENMVASLARAGCEVTWIGPLHAPVERAVGKVLDAACRMTVRQRVMYFHNGAVARRFGREGSRKLATAGSAFDLVFGGNAIDLADLRTDLPMVLALDATVAGLRDYYPAYSNVVGWSMRELMATERRAVRRAAAVLYSSRWAAASAVADYGVSAAKVHVIPFGAVLDQPPPASVLERRARGARCRLLFLALDWERKGGAIALETVRALEGQGVDAELVVCGCAPPPGQTHPRLRVIPFLDKRDLRQRAALEALFVESDFLLLPTRGDCTPNAIAEADAYGLPAVTTDTGGVGEMVADGESGFLLPLAARGDAYAAVIAAAWADPARCAALARAARRRYEERLNWDAWARAALPLLALAAGTASPARTVLPSPARRGWGRGHALANPGKVT